MMIEPEVTMGVNICWSVWKAKRPPEPGSVEEVAKELFKLVRDDSHTWYATSDDQRFRIACGVLLMHYKDTETEERLKHTLTVLRTFAAMVSGVPVDVSQLTSDETEPLPLVQWWKDSAA